MDNTYPIRSQLATFDDDQVINARELAQLLGTTGANVYKLSCHTPANLPPRLQGFGRRLAWRLGTCRAWIRARDGSASAEPSEAPTRPRTGRPRLR